MRYSLYPIIQTNKLEASWPEVNRETSISIVESVFPWEPHSYWIKINCISLQKWEIRTDSITCRQTQSHNEVFTTMNAAEEQGRRTTTQICYSYQQWLHKQHCSSHLPGETVTSVHSSHSCYPRQRMNLFTPLKKQPIYYHRPILNMMTCE